MEREIVGNGIACLFIYVRFKGPEVRLSKASFGEKEEEKGSLAWLG